MANGGRSSRSASGPLVSPPRPHRWCVEGRGAVIRSEPFESPPRFSLWFVGVPVGRAVGLRCLAPRAFRSVHSCGPFSPPPSEPGVGWRMCRVACPSRPGTCARVPLVILVGAPGAFQADLRRCTVLSGGGVSRFPDACASRAAVRPSAVFAARCVCGVKATQRFGKKGGRGQR